ncbi:MAG: alanine--tRNA ligase [Clostridia bacterium]|nr:alanine--tRNA ligase [Clostridia bacterium]
MEWTGLNEIREKYLSFFESKGHLRLPSFSLVPQGDKSLLLINSGMAPMKKYFTGEVTPPKQRVTTCQKCIRTPDIERVGKTARHGTYFEMLGNFSFGDYFKHEAIEWAWEFSTKVMELPVDKLFVSIYEDDDETYDIWTKDIGVSPDHMVRLGKEDNFWEHGAGPCGPCSEIHYDRGEVYGCGSADCAVGCDCDRFVEFWNLVFTQFENDGNNNYTSLAKPNIDTGMGLERLACISQGVDNLFEVDTVQNIMNHIMQIADVKYHVNEKIDVSLRVITDHIRSTTFMIGDGVMPSNEGRGYVLRRLLRRAARHGRLLGINHAFLADVCETVIKENASAYPNLVEKHDFIVKIIQSEEESFEKTIDTGMQLLTDMIKNAQGSVLSGEDAFKLSDTFGFPIDLTKEILEEKSMTVDEEKFAQLVSEQRQRARLARKDAGADAWKGTGNAADNLEKTDFVGYTTFHTDAKIEAIIINGESSETAEQGDDAIIVLNQTPFYAESGGQIGDIGIISNDGFTFEVDNTIKTQSGVFLHEGTIITGSVKLGDTVKAQVDEQVRKAIMRNHTAAHLLQAALRKVLGNHVEQAGQLVNASAVRFDFSHFSALTEQEIALVEREINTAILSGALVTSTEMSIDEAKAMGAMALFGEKYGNIVRVVKSGDLSIELCGGTHVDNTGKLGLFKIISESSVAAGVRRIEAVTGFGVLDFITEKESLIKSTAQAMKLGNTAELASRASVLVTDLKTNEKQIEQLSAELASISAKSMIDNAKELNGIRLITAIMKDTAPNDLRTICDSAKQSGEDIVVVVAGTQSKKGSVNFACACGKDAVSKGAHAGNILKEVAKIADGSGGGKPDSAMAGGKDASKTKDAMSAVESIVSAMIK